MTDAERMASLRQMAARGWTVPTATDEDVAFLLSRIDAPKEMVAEQAKDEGLWFVARTAPEAYLQQELRRLHGLIESGIDTGGD